MFAITLKTLTNRFFIALFGCVLAYGNAQADADKVLCAEDLYKKCLSDSQKLWDTGVTSKMQEGTELYGLCLKDGLRKILIEADMRPERIDKVIDLLDAQEKLLAEVYWEVNCPLPMLCGSIQSSMAGGYASGKTKEDILTISKNVRCGGAPEEG
jgi:hypothetical protein